MVPKAFKEVKQQVDIVGKGRGDHGDSSWKGFAVFSRRTCHYRLCQVIYAHPSGKYEKAANVLSRSSNNTLASTTFLSPLVELQFTHASRKFSQRPIKYGWPCGPSL